MSDKPYTECTPEEWAAIESLAKTAGTIAAETVCGSTVSVDVRLIEPPNWWSACALCDGIYDHICSCQMIAQGDTEQQAVDNLIAGWNRRVS